MLRTICDLTILLALAGTLGHAPSLYAQSDSSLPHAVVHFQVFDCFGARATEAHIHLRSPDRKEDVAPIGRSAVISGIPYGYYLVSASDNGSSSMEHEITVNTKEVWVRIGLSFPAGDRVWPGGGLSIIGDIQPTPKGPDKWVRIAGTFLHLSREAPISNAGHFEIGGLEMGAYVVEVFEGPKLVHAESIEIDNNEPVRHLHISLPRE